MTTRETEDLVITLRYLEKLFNGDAVQIAIWLTSKNDLLAKARPLDLFEKGYGKRVLTLISRSDL